MKKFYFIIIVFIIILSIILLVGDGQRKTGLVINNTLLSDNVINVSNDTGIYNIQEPTSEINNSITSNNTVNEEQKGKNEIKTNDTIKTTTSTSKNSKQNASSNKTTSNSNGKNTTDNSNNSTIINNKDKQEASNNTVNKQSSATSSKPSNNNTNQGKEEKHIHAFTVNGGWFKTEEEAEKKVDEELAKWDKKFEEDIKNSKTEEEKDKAYNNYLKNCPNGYETFRCSCGEYGLNFTYR